MIMTDAEKRDLLKAINGRVNDKYLYEYANGAWNMWQDIEYVFGLFTVVEGRKCVDIITEQEAEERGLI